VDRITVEQSSESEVCAQLSSTFPATQLLPAISSIVTSSPRNPASQGETQLEKSSAVPSAQLLPAVIDIPRALAPNATSLPSPLLLPMS
jgi:hypothetical protein